MTNKERLDNLERRLQENDNEKQELLDELNELREKISSGFKPTKENLVDICENDLHDEFYDDVLHGWSDPEKAEEIKIDDEWSIKMVESCGGSEGDGEERWVVFALLQTIRNGIGGMVPNNPLVHSYWKVPGYYASFNGSEFEVYNMHQVKQEQRTVNVWV